MAETPELQAEVPSKDITDSVDHNIMDLESDSKPKFEGEPAIDTITDSDEKPVVNSTGEMEHSEDVSVPTPTLNEVENGDKDTTNEEEEREVVDSKSSEDNLDGQESEESKQEAGIEVVTENVIVQPSVEVNNESSGQVDINSITTPSATVETLDVQSGLQEQKKDFETPERPPTPGAEIVADTNQVTEQPQIALEKDDERGDADGNMVQEKAGDVSNVVVDNAVLKDTTVTTRRDADGDQNAEDQGLTLAESGSEANEDILRNKSGTAHKVSFGENGSMVETLIIDNSNMPAEEKHFYQENILRGNVTTDLNKGRLKDDVEQPPAASSNQQGNGHRVTFAESPVEHTTTVIENESVNGASSQTTTITSSQVNQSSSTAAPAGSPTQGTMPAPVIRLQRTRSMESHENPFMAGGELDSKADYIIRHSKISRTEIRIADPDSPQPQEEIQMETIEKVEAAPVSAAAPGGNPKENGKVEDPLKPQNVEVEVDKANASQPETQEPEQVKSKDKKPKCKCCVIQ